MTTYSCPHCGAVFNPEDFGEFLTQGSVTVAYKSYAAAIQHIKSCPLNPLNARMGDSVPKAQVETMVKEAVAKALADARAEIVQPAQPKRTEKVVSE